MTPPDASSPARRIRDYENVDIRLLPEGGRARRYVRRAEDLFFERIFAEGGSLFVDLGCGPGLYAPLYAHRFRGAIMADYAMSQAQEAAEAWGHLPHILFLAADACRMPLRDGAADGVMSIRVAHHMADLDAYFAEAGRVLAPGGNFFFDYANKRTLRQILRLLAGKPHHRPFREDNAEVEPMLFHAHPALVRGLCGRHGMPFRRRWNVGLTRQFGALLSRMNFKTEWLLRLGRLPAWMDLFASTYVHAAKHPKGARLEFSDVKNALACPRCGAFPLAEQPAAMACPACGSSYPRVGRVYDFRLPEAARVERVPDWRRRQA